MDGWMDGWMEYLYMLQGQLTWCQWNRWLDRTLGLAVCSFRVLNNFIVLNVEEVCCTDVCTCTL